MLESVSGTEAPRVGPLLEGYLTGLPLSWCLLDAIRGWEEETRSELVVLPTMLSLGVSGP